MVLPSIFGYETSFYNHGNPKASNMMKLLSAVPLCPTVEMVTHLCIHRDKRKKSFDFYKNFKEMLANDSLTTSEKALNTARTIGFIFRVSVSVVPGVNTAVLLPLDLGFTAVHHTLALMRFSTE